MAQKRLQTSEAYYERASEFLPERWLRDTQAATGCPKRNTTNPFVLLPFGFGPRMCIGKRFAELEIEALASHIVRRYRVEWMGPEPEFQVGLIEMPLDRPLFKLTKID